MMQERLDLRGRPVPEAGRALMERYNRLAAGARMEAVVDALGPALEMWLVEAGVRHDGGPADGGGLLLAIERAASPALTALPGLHHVVAGRSGTVWACTRDRRVMRVDGDSGAVLAVAEVATKASHIALDGRERRLFVADFGADEVVAVDAETLRVEGRWPAPGGPQLPMVTAAGFVCQTGPGAGTLTILAPRAGGFAARTVEVGAVPHDPIASADGESVFVPCAGSGEVVRVGLARASVDGAYPVGDGPSHLALHPDGNRLYVANTFSGDLVCLSVEGEILRRGESGRWSHVPRLSPDGSLVCVANFRDDTVTVLDADTLERRALLATDPYPHDLVFSPDGGRLLVTGFSSAHVRIYDPRAGVEIGRAEVGRAPAHAAFMPGGGHAWVACAVDDRLARVDL